MKNVINSNPLASNGIQITEGSKVLWTNPSRYESNGAYIVGSVGETLVELEHIDGSCPNYFLAEFNELRVLV